MLGGLTDTVSDVTDPVVDLVDPVVAPVVDAVPEVAAQVSLSLPVAEAQVGVTLSGREGALAVGLAADVDVDLPIVGQLDVDGGVDTGVGSTPPTVAAPPAPVVVDDPSPARPESPVRQPPVSGASSVALPAAPSAAILNTDAASPPAADGDAGGAATRSAPAGLGPQIEGLLRQLSDALIGQGGSFLAGIAALLTLLALVPPLTRGGLLPASAFWRPMRFVSPPDPPG